MRTRITLILIVLVYFVIGVNQTVSGQTIDDWEAHPTLFLKYKTTDKLSLESKYEHRLDQNFGPYKKSVIGIKTAYKFPMARLGISNRL